MLLFLLKGMMIIGGVPKALKVNQGYSRVKSNQKPESIRFHTCLNNSYSRNYVFVKLRMDLYNYGLS